MVAANEEEIGAIGDEDDECDVNCFHCLHESFPDATLLLSDFETIKDWKHAKKLLLELHKQCAAIFRKWKQSGRHDDVEDVLEEEKDDDFSSFTHSNWKILCLHKFHLESGLGGSAGEPLPESVKRDSGAGRKPNKEKAGGKKGRQSAKRKSDIAVADAIASMSAASKKRTKIQQKTHHAKAVALQEAAHVSHGDEIDDLMEKCRALKKEKKELEKQSAQDSDIGMIEKQLKRMKDRIKFLEKASAKAKQIAEALSKEEIVSSPEEKKPPAKKRKVSTSSSKSNSSKSSSKRAVVQKKKKKMTIEINSSSSESDDNSDLEVMPLTSKRGPPTKRKLAPNDVESIPSSSDEEWKKRGDQWTATSQQKTAMSLWKKRHCQSIVI